MDIFCSITNIILTICLVSFGALQWKSIEKQNKYNMLRLRLEHVSNLNYLFTTTLKVLTDVANQKISEDEGSLSLPQTTTQLIKLSLESKIIFSKDISFLESSLIDHINELMNHDNITIDILKKYIIILSNIFSELYTKTHYFIEKDTPKL